MVQCIIKPCLHVPAHPPSCPRLAQRPMAALGGHLGGVTALEYQHEDKLLAVARWVLLLLKLLLLLMMMMMLLMLMLMLMLLLAANACLASALTPEYSGCDTRACGPAL